MIVVEALALGACAPGKASRSQRPICLSASSSEHLFRSPSLHGGWYVRQRPLLIDYATGVVELEEFVLDLHGRSMPESLPWWSAASCHVCKIEAPTYRELLQDTGAPTAALLEKLDGRRRRVHRRSSIFRAEPAPDVAKVGRL